MDKKSYTFEEIKQKMVNYCVYQDRCHKEVEQKMRDFLLIEDAKEEILIYLMKENYLNEERFAKSYTRGKFNMKKWGRLKIKSHLRFKGINDRLINFAMQEIDIEDYNRTIKNVFDRQMELYTGLKDYEKRNKSIKYLIAKGYEYEIIMNNVLD